ncbi:MAG: GNAT family N-acetyltransferase, partial [Chloroflexi bacterium]|nr:GNAT family N-acetyltransferase [Chloroflexota bacterium]
MVTVRIRPAVPTDAPGISKGHVDSWRTTYAGIVPSGYFASLSYSRRQHVWENVLKAHKPDNCIIVAVTLDGAIVGFAHAGPEREGETGYDAELYAIYLLQEHQSRGVGRRLTIAAGRGA